MDLEKPKDAGEEKIKQYVERITKKGESAESILEGLPDYWKTKIQEGVLNASTLKEQEEKTIKEIRERLGILNVEDIIAKIKSEIVDDLNGLSPDDLKKQIKLRNDLVSWENKGNLDDDVFIAGKGNYYEDKKGNGYSWKSVDGDIGKDFDSHGLSKTDQLERLLNLLENGIDTSKTFYTAPFELPDEYKAALGAALGTGDGTAYKDGIAVVASGFKERLSVDGIKHVFINDVYQSLRDPLEKAFPKYQFHLLSEQNRVLEEEAGKS